MDIHFFAQSDIGRVRTANEDFFLNEKIAEEEFLFIIADGMGGHQAGDVASKLASETFFDSYRSLRKKGTPIQASMELSMRKANSMVFKKAASDIAKRGMGTTFSAVVVAGMKAAIAHVGDSRVYLVRKGRIRRLTTDHSFVEKLVEEGRISADEARDHPQKNVLYMSLGARESFTPEMQSDIALEEGDALVMCSDGLSNMVDDGTLMNVTMDSYPEEAAHALVKLANARGGTDNITVQVVRLGTLETLEKTKPIRLSKPRRKLVKALSLLVLLAILAGLWLLFLAPERGAGEVESGKAARKPQAAMSRAPRITEIDSSPLAGLGVAAAHCRFLSGGKLVVVRERRLFVLRLDGPDMTSIELGGEDQVVPSRDGEIYLLRREPTQTLGYQLLRQSEGRILLRIQFEKQVSSKESKPGSVSLYRIAGLQGPIVPDYIDGRIFIFHDQRRYFEIKDWQTPESLPAVIDDLDVSAAARLSFKDLGGRMTMLYSDPASGRTSVFSVRDIVVKSRDIPGLRLPQPLLLEYLDGQALRGYYPDECVELDGGRTLASHRYHFNNFRLRIVKVLVDMVDGRKLIVNDGNKLFALACET
ncbi:MAG: Stp1/IreP family PP2C-type Ser/Thr phosphatase [Acidobacteria bacterium]|jgi:protein phosphatase|nr:Stp1/IreP family PP2C-type Ser/Thr phosphatase [Acidobacteriota bacterium]